MRARLVAAALASVVPCLAACDAGDRARGENTSPGPEVRITTPRMDQVLAVPMEGDATRDPVEVMVDLRNYQVGKVDEGGNGQHLHVIVDDQPYLACYDASRAFPVGKLKRGSHVL